MTAVTLPNSPRPSVISWELVDYGGTVSSSLGGSAQRVNRLGNRWAVTVSLPPLTAKQAREWAPAMSKALRLGALFKLSQPGLATGSPGTPLVNGAGQSGNSLVLDGLNPGYVVRSGQWLSVTTSSKKYLYQSTSNVMADASGNATVTIDPASRVTPANNDPVELGAPYIEGLLDGPQGWQIDTDHLSRGFVFTITETR